MLKNIRRTLKKECNNNNGSAIVIVIIALAMVGILAATIMWMSMSNYYMKATDKGNKQGFYTSETVFEQIKAGLEEDVSQAASQAYAYILTKDYSSASLNDKNYDFRQHFQIYFADIVNGDLSDSYKYDIDHLRSFVDPALGIETDTDTGGGPQTTGKVKYLGSNSSYRLAYEPANSVIKLEGVHLEYTDVDERGNEYISQIDTDIVISIPDVSFTQISPLPDVFNYALIANQKLLKNETGEAYIKGNIYAGDDGIKLLNSMSISKADYVISKGNVEIGRINNEPSPSRVGLKIEDPRTPTGNTEFWADDIILGSNSILETKKTDTYVADDMTLSGNKASVKMGENGSYVGYGNGNIASKSSAIVVNGLGSTVDMKNLKKTVLLGRTFVSLKEPDHPYYPASEPKEIMMAESIAVKGEQVAFLLPSKYLTIKDVAGNEVPIPNPVVKDLYTPPEFDSLYNCLNAAIPDAISKFNADYGDISITLKPIYPVGSQLAYVYMKMSEDDAEKYYEQYYKDNMEKIDTYFAVYAGGKIELPAGTTITDADFISSEGGYSSPVSSNIISGGETFNSQLNKATPTFEKDKINSDCESIKNNLCAKLIKEGATYEELNNTVIPFDNIIRRTDVRNLISNNPGLSGSGWRAVRFDSPETGSALFVETDSSSFYSYGDNTDDTSIRVLIVLGNVRIKTHFTGLLMATGTISVDDGVIISSILNSPEKLQELKNSLQTPKEVNIDASLNKDNRRALQYFVDGSEYDLDGLAGTSSVSRNKIEFKELVLFNNWVKK